MCSLATLLLLLAIVASLQPFEPMRFLWKTPSSRPPSKPPKITRNGVLLLVVDSASKAHLGLEFFLLTTSPSRVRVDGWPPSRAVRRLWLDA